MAICEVESEFQGEWIRCFKVSDLDLDFMKHWDKVNTSNLREAGLLLEQRALPRPTVRRLF